MWTKTQSSKWTKTQSSNCWNCSVSPYEKFGFPPLINWHFKQHKMLEHWKVLPCLALETIPVHLGNLERKMVGVGGDHVKTAVNQSISPPSWVFKCDIWAAQW